MQEDDCQQTLWSASHFDRFSRCSKCEKLNTTCQSEHKLNIIRFWNRSHGKLTAKSFTKSGRAPSLATLLSQCWSPECKLIQWCNLHGSLAGSKVYKQHPAFLADLVPRGRTNATLHDIKNIDVSEIFGSSLLPQSTETKDDQSILNIPHNMIQAAPIQTI